MRKLRQTKQDTRSQTHSDLDSCKLVVFLGISKPRTLPTVLDRKRRLRQWPSYVLLRMWAPWHWIPLLAPGLHAKWGILCTNDREDDQAPVTFSHPLMTIRTVIMENRSTRLGALTQATQSVAIAPSILESHHFPKGSLQSGKPLYLFLLGLAPRVSMSTQCQRYTHHEVTSPRHWSLKDSLMILSAMCMDFL